MPDDVPPGNNPEPAPDPAPEPDTTGQQDNELAQLVDRLSSFDPSEFSKRLDALEQQGGGASASDLGETFRPFFDDIEKQLKDTGDAIKKLFGQKPAPPPKQPDSDVPPDVGQPSPSPAPQQAKSSLLSALTEVPKIDG